jgi:lipoic acid synthetase
MRGREIPWLFNFDKHTNNPLKRASGGDMANFPIINNGAGNRSPKPPWLKVKAPAGKRYNAIRKRLRNLNLFTVCEEAHCPNIGECWGGGTATIMLMGEICTRGCRFCAVTTGKPPALDPTEPEHAAQTVVAMGVDYIVLTSVNRDDLADGGAEHFAETVSALKRLERKIMVEVLIPDFQGSTDAVDTLIASGPEVIAHNVETIRRLSRGVRDARANFDQSLKILGHIHTAGKGKGPLGVDVLAKTSIMCGLGETEPEIVEAMQDLRRVGVDVVTFGQYLRPSAKHLPVVEYVTPEQFDRYAEIARDLGFLYVASGPLVRSSYRAGEYYLKAHIDSEMARRRESAP